MLVLSLGTSCEAPTQARAPLFPVSGGLPIIVDNQLSGAIGVGGSNKDEECAYTALTQVVGPQPPLAGPPPAPAQPSPAK